MSTIHPLTHVRRSAVGALACSILAIAPQRGTHAQPAPPRVVSKDSVTIAAGTHYDDVSGFQRFFLGNTYRDLWSTPVRVPVLNLRTFAGGLVPLKEGGGKQTKNLRLGARDGSEYVFRLVNKENVNPPHRYRGTLVEKIYRDQVSAMYPGAGVIAAPIVDAAGVLHATPQFAAMPNDTLLGKFREDFIEQLATIEEYPNKPDDAPGFGGAEDVIDSDELIPLLDSTSNHRVDDRAFLAARLTDFVIADVDRHHGNWKWARFGESETPRWVPIPRDRDHAFHNYDGFLARIASRFAPNLMTFEGRYPSIKALSGNSREVDERLLAGLEKPVWDSVAAALVSRITDAVIDSAVRRVPPEYRHTAPAFAAKIKQRRAGLPAIATEFYRTLARVVDVHATDAADRATITYHDGGLVDVHLETRSREVLSVGRASSSRRSTNGAGSPSVVAAPYFRRRFDARETAEVRVYLHDGDDEAVVRGSAPSGVRVRIIGGNGTNQLADSSRGSRLARLYDVGRVMGISYGPDSGRDTLFDRRPWVKDTGAYEPPNRDYGSRRTPTADLAGGSGLGFVPQLGMTWTRYGFRKYPYASEVELTAAYSTSVGGYRVTLTGDRRLENSRLHYMGLARMSDFEVINWYGYGNNTGGEPEDAFEVRQRQWILHPTVAFALGRRDSDITLGPVVQYASTDSVANRFIAAERPYGFGDFGQVGVRLGLRYDTRDNEDYATRGFLLDANGATYPAVWDAKSAYSSVGGFATAFVPLAAIPRNPVLAFRGGGRKIYGDAPFFDAAFIGGRGTVRGMDAQRYAGDASLYGTTELRVPLGTWRTILPIDIGVMSFVDVGRVWVDGSSPRGWHSVAGGGLWFGILDQATGGSITFTNSSEKRVLIGTGLRF